MSWNEGADGERPADEYALELTEMVGAAVDLCRRFGILHAGAMDRLAADHAEADAERVEIHRRFLALLGPLAAATRASLPGLEELAARLRKRE